MKRKLILFFIALAGLFFNSPLVTAYWGYGEDCREEHGINYIDIPHTSKASISLDGIPRETMWSNDKYNEGHIQVPLASDYYSSNFFIIYLDLVFIMDDDYIYILAKWEDTTTRPDDGTYDGLAFCWNMDVPNFSAAFFPNMKTDMMGGGYVDSWMWKCRSTSPSNGSSYLLIDDCFGDSGWIHSSSDIDDVEIAYTYTLDKSYTLEIKRKLDTSHQYDVNFLEEKLYFFNMAILDNGTMADHAISWTYALDLRKDKSEENEEGDNTNFISSFIFPYLIVGIILISSSLIILDNKKTIKLER